MGPVPLPALGTCPGPLEMGALTVNGSRHKALLRSVRVRVRVPDNGERVPDTFNGTGYILLIALLSGYMLD